MPLGPNVGALHDEAHGETLVSMRRVRDGEPILPGEALARRGEDGVIRVIHGTVKAGPAQVATESYRGGWDRIFGGTQPVGEA